MENVSSNQKSDVEASTEAPKPKNNQQGLGSKFKKQEIFTKKKNVQGAKRVQENSVLKLEEKYGTLATFDSLNPMDDQLLKEIVTGCDVNHPTIEVLVSTVSIPKLTEETIQFLSNQKVTLNLPHDARVLEQATMFQVRAKVLKARATTAKAAYPGDDPYLEKTLKYMNRVIGSHELLLDQIGVVEHGKQKFVPKLEAPPLYEVPDGHVRTDITYKNQRMYVPAAHAFDPFGCPAGDRLFVDENRFANFDQVVRDYEDLMQRIDRKCRYAVRRYDFNNTTTTPQVL